MPNARYPRSLDAGPLQADIDLFELHLIQENLAKKTKRTYTEAAQWFAADGPDFDDWSDVTRKHIELWVAWLFQRGYSDSYVNNQYRALQQFFRWYAEAEEVANPTLGMKPPKIRPKMVPILTDEDLDKLLKACRGKGFQPRRDTAVISLFRDTGVRLAELAGLALDDVDLKRREAKVTGKGGKQRTVRFTAGTALALGQYLKERARHRRHGENALWLGARGKGPMTADGVYQLIKRRADEAGVQVHPHQFRHTFSHNWLDNGGGEWDLVELNGWNSPQMLKIYGRSAASSRARRSYDHIMQGA